MADAYLTALRMLARREYSEHQIRERLTALYPGIKFIGYKEFGNIHGPKQRDIIAGLADKLRELKCDAVILGIGA